MEKIKEFKYVIILILAILVCIFYWFQLRPSNIRKECKKYVSESRLDLTSDIEKEELGNDMIKINKAEQEKADFWYKDCLNSKGLIN